MPLEKEQRHAALLSHCSSGLFQMIIAPEQLLSHQDRGHSDHASSNRILGSGAQRLLDLGPRGAARASSAASPQSIATRHNRIVELRESRPSPKASWNSATCELLANTGLMREGRQAHNGQRIRRLPA